MEFAASRWKCASATADLGANLVGVWRPTPLLSCRSRQRWTARSTKLTSARSIRWGLSGSGRSPDQSELALFWNGNTPLYWNRIAAQISTGRGLSLAENARLFAVLNVAMADAAIACWDGKYRYIKNEGRPRRSSSVKVRQQPVVHRITNKTTCVSDKRAKPRP
jgi:hypothetical protein